MIFEYSCYRKFLGDELRVRTQRNRQYSMRAMARELGISSATFSHVLAGNRHLSLESAIKISEKLKLDVRGMAYFRLLHRLDAERNPEVRDFIQDQLSSLQSREFSLVDLDAFHIISDWYHFAILPLVQIEGQELSSKRISKRLGISEEEARDGLDRLLRVEVLKEDKKNGYRAHKRVLARSEKHNEALKSFHAQMLKKASNAITEEPPESRFVGSETLAFEPERIEEAKKMIDSFLENFQKKFSAKQGSEVFHIGTHFFRISQPLERQEKK